MTNEELFVCCFILVVVLLGKWLFKPHYCIKCQGTGVYGNMCCTTCEGRGVR
jgi:DnaJ-class molecular chaperone